MKKSIIKIKFSTPVHLGKNSIYDNGYELRADTLFSALCLESRNIEGLVDLVRNGKLKISDAFPYIGSEYYIPKPMIYVQNDTENYKVFKKIKYISFEVLEDYLEGTLDPLTELECFLLGESDLRTQVCVGEDPFQVGTFTFYENSGLYVIVEHEDDTIFKLFDSLQYSGIGGKRSSGLGRFTYSVDDCFEFKQGNKKILLNTAMAKNNELDLALEGANYLLQKRSGFINQSKYKKQDFYTFTAGSIFLNEFEGDIFDVGNDEHPVYRYGVPMFMEVEA